MMLCPSLRRLVAFALVPVLSAVGAGVREPNPEFDQGHTDLRAFLDPEVEVLMEAESLTPLPAGWRSVTSEWLKNGCSGGAAVSLAESGEAVGTVVLPRPGRYRLWVRSHGAATRSFQVGIDGRLAEGTFGSQGMSWADGGVFDLPTARAALRLCEVRRNPYADCLLLTSRLDRHPDQLRPLRAWAGDERWVRIGEPVGFDGRFSLGDIAAWQWDFGQGQAQSGKTARHVFDVPGDCLVTLTVTDRGGRSHAHAVRVHACAPAERTVLAMPLRRVGPPRFGDLDGDRRVDVLVGDPYRWVDAYRHDGTLLWSYDSPAEFPTPVQRREHPMVIWDLDGDGVAEVPMWRHAEGAEWLCLCDALTGAVKRRVPWPLADSYINGRLAVGNLTGRPDHGTILAFSGQFSEGNAQQVDAYDAELNHLWSFRRQGSDILGHFPYSADGDGDGREEVFASAAMLRPDGRLGWERNDLRADHADSIRLADIDADGRLDVVCAYSSLGVMVLSAATGETLWNVPANHAQQLEVADVRPDVPGLEIIVGDRFYLPCLRARLLVFDCRGNLLSAVPETALQGNPNLGVLEWDGQPGLEIAWANLVLDGRGRVLAVLPGNLHHAIDIADDGREEFVCIAQGADGTRRLTAFGTAATAPTLPVRQDLEARRKIVNHTHY